MSQSQFARCVIKKATPKLVFLSYAEKHRRLGEAIARKLESNSLSVWDAFSRPTGSPVFSEIERALNTADSMIAILDQHSFSSSLVRKELDHAFFDKRYKNRLLPVFVGDRDEDFVRLPWILNKLTVLHIKDSAYVQKQATRIVEAFLKQLSASPEK